MNTRFLPKTKPLQLLTHLTPFLVCMLFLAKALVAIGSVEWKSCGAGLFSLILALLPFYLMKKRYFFPAGLLFLYEIFLLGTMFFGEFLHFYARFGGWDMVMHVLAGFFFGAVFFSFYQPINHHVASLWGAILWCFSTSVTISLLWEFWEYLSDQLFGSDMQRDTLLPHIASRLLPTPGTVAIPGETVAGAYLKGHLDIGLHDTMSDLLLGAAGALFFCLWYFLARRKKGVFARSLALFLPVMGKKS